jgi:glucose/arabinose dehydrogenase
MRRTILLGLVVLALAGCSAKVATTATTSTTSATATTAAPAASTSPPSTAVATTTAPPATTTATTMAPTGGAPITRSPAGNLYRAGEYCPGADAGYTIQGSDGPITCTGGRWVTG